MMGEDETWISHTFKLALESAKEGFDPFGAILVKEGMQKASSKDKCILYSDPTAHAELILISEYCREHQLMSLEGYTLYTNVEPCFMCSGAIHWAKIDRVVFSVSQQDLKTVSKGNPKPTCEKLLNLGGRKVEVVSGVLREEGLKLLRAFPFRSKKERHQEYWKK
ncbi:MAG: nucleoside deaminase [Bacteroidota bacterium]